MVTATNREVRTLTARQVENLLAHATKGHPEVEALEVSEPAVQTRSLAHLVESDPGTYDARRAAIRDRYIAIRFEGIARSSADLADPVRVIKAARLKFEEDHPDGALELLELAIEQNPHDEKLWLAEIELAFLLRYRKRFVESARAFRVAHPASAAWDDVDRLGRAIAPEEKMFGEHGKRAHEHYGPWPHLPNWIAAPWDLTSDVLAADFHMAMTRKERPRGR